MYYFKEIQVGRAIAFKILQQMENLAHALNKTTKPKAANGPPTRPSSAERAAGAFRRNNDSRVERSFPNDMHNANESKTVDIQ